MEQEQEEEEIHGGGELYTLDRDQYSYTGTRGTRTFRYLDIQASSVWTEGLPFSIVSKFVNLDAESYYRRQIILPFFQSSSLIGSFVSRGQCVRTGMQMKLDDLAKFPLILFLCSILYSIQYTTWRIFTARKSPLVRIFTSWKILLLPA